MIPRRNLSLLSNRLARAGGRRLPESILERDYCIAWFLVGLATSPLRDALVFKGGTALKRCYFGAYRFSEDMDFTLGQEIALGQVLSGLRDFCGEVERLSGVVIRIAREGPDPHANTHTFYLGYEGPLPGGGKEIKVDITRREWLASPPTSRPVLRGYEEYSDLPDDAKILVYSLAEIAIEKLVALTDPARNEPRDLYDLWFLLEGDHVRLAEIHEDFRRKRAFKGHGEEPAGEALARKEARLKRDWERRLGGQMTDLPPFEAVMRSVRRHLRQLGMGGGARD
jgi:hypothetical protein